MLQFRPTAINRADLLACLSACGPDNLATHCDARVAELAGFAPVPKAERHAEARTEITVFPEIVGTATSIPPPPSSPRARFHYVTARQIFDPAETVSTEPQWFREAQPLSLEQQRGATDWQALPPAPLTPWRRVWPVLRRVLGALRSTGEPDVARVVDSLARGRPLRRMPWQTRHTWTPECVLVLDYSPRLAMFWHDFNRLRDSLEKLRGRGGLRVWEEVSGVPGRRFDKLTDRGWESAKLRPGTPILLLSDLGLHEASGSTRAEWARRGRTLRAAGLEPVALLPAGRGQWHTDLAPLFYPLYWDRDSRFPRALQRKPGAPEPLLPDGLDTLFTLLAPAVRVEPGLLRAVRTLSPNLGVEVEAAAWQSPQVRACLSGFALLPEARQAYLEKFRGLPESVRTQVVELLRQHHTGLPQVVLCEELRAAGLPDGSTALRHGSGQGSPSSDAYLAQILKTLAQQPLAGMTAWGQRATGRYPASGWQHDEQMSALWVLAHRDELEHGAPLPEGLELRRVAWLLDKGGPEATYALRQRGEQLFLTPETPGPGTPNLGSLLAYLRAVSPYVQWERTASPLRTGSPVYTPIPLPEEGGLLLQTDREALWLDALEKPAWAEAVGRDGYGLYAEFAVGGVIQRMRWIAPGSFLMGSPESEAGRDDDERQHPVSLTQGYWLADTACTQALWQAGMGNNPSRFKGDDRPVEMVSWDDAQGFIKKLNQAISDLNIRLPTEAEWEYACRAGTQTPFWFGDNITPEQVNYDGNYPYPGGKKGQYRKQTVDVKDLPCNAWGLYQMHGNVWEWCQDWFGDYSAEAVTDPSGPDSGGYRVLRGGSWDSLGRYVRSASRDWFTPADRYVSIGFRLARGQ